MEYMGSLEASRVWNIPSEQITKYCRKGKINGAEQDEKGSPWRIPVNSSKPDYKPRKKSSD